MNATDRGTLNLILSQSQKAGAKLPKAVIDGFAITERIHASARTLGASHDDLAVAVTTALAAARDPATDTEVQRLLAARSLRDAGLTMAVEQAATDSLRETLRDCADDVLRAVKKATDPAADELSSAHSVIGDTPLTDTAAVLNAGPEAAEAWATARRALEIVLAGGRTFTALMGFTRLLDLNPHLKPLTYAAIDWQTWTTQQYGSSDHNAGPWDLVRAGLRLELPDVEEYRRRLAVIDNGHRQTQIEAERRNRDALSGRQAVGA